MIQFDPIDHKYSLGDQPYFSVTQMLRGLKLTPPYPEGEDKGQKALGTACHKAADLVMWDRLDTDGTSLALMPYVNGVIEKKREMNIRPIATELILYDPVRCYAGTLDLFCFVYDSELAVFDYKRGGAPNCTELQTAGYETLLRQADQRGLIPPVMVGNDTRLALWMGYPIRRFSMKLEPNRAIVKEYSDPLDLAAWSGVVDLFKWKLRQK